MTENQPTPTPAPATDAVREAILRAHAHISDLSLNHHLPRSLASAKACKAMADLETALRLMPPLSAPASPASEAARNALPAMSLAIIKAATTLQNAGENHLRDQLSDAWADFSIAVFRPDRAESPASPAPVANPVGLREALMRLRRDGIPDGIGDMCFHAYKAGYSDCRIDAVAAVDALSRSPAAPEAKPAAADAEMVGRLVEACEAVLEQHGVYQTPLLPHVKEKLVSAIAAAKETQ